MLYFWLSLLEVPGSKIYERIYTSFLLKFPAALRLGNKDHTGFYSLEILVHILENMLEYPVLQKFRREVNNINKLFFIKLEKIVIEIFLYIKSKEEKISIEKKTLTKEKIDFDSKLEFVFTLVHFVFLNIRNVYEEKETLLDRINPRLLHIIITWVESHFHISILLVKLFLIF